MQWCATFMVTGGDARLPHGRALRGSLFSFVLNYEEGGERNVLDGDAHAENYLVPEVVGLPPIAGRSRIVEDLFEYRSRAGFWRVLRLFEERGLHFTSWAVGLATNLATSLAGPGPRKSSAPR